MELSLNPVVEHGAREAPGAHLQSVSTPAPAQTTTNLFSVPIDLPFLDVTCQMTLFALLHVGLLPATGEASLTQQSPLL